jgi:tRNA pseudouridine55 synthase
LEQIQAAAKKFTGEILQRPPAFSALKVAGRRAYQIARKGGQVELAPRPVSISRIHVRSYRYPELILEVDCGGGTYIRSLGRDLAESLGTATVMSALTRTAVGRYRLEEAIDPGELSAENLERHLRPLLQAVEYLPRRELSADEIAHVHHGGFLERQTLPAEIATAPEIAAIDADGRLVAILVPRDDRLLQPDRNFSC